MSTNLVSALAGLRPRSAELEGLRDYQRLCRSFRTIEVSYQAKIVRDHATARWVRQHDVAVDVRTSEQLRIAVASGIKPTRIVVHGDKLRDDELRCAANLGVGRVIVGNIRQIELLGTLSGRIRGALVRMTDPAAPGITDFGLPFATDEADAAIRSVLAQNQLRIAGLHVKVGPDEHAFISCPAAVGNMIAEMQGIHRRHGLVLTRLGIDCASLGPIPVDELRELAAGIDEAIEDGCAGLRFPRPRVQLST